MKASEWVEKLSNAEVTVVLRGFVQEARELAGKRGGSASATAGAVREQREKWLAVCRKCPKVTPKMFDVAIDMYDFGLKQGVLS